MCAMRKVGAASGDPSPMRSIPVQCIPTEEVIAKLEMIGDLGENNVKYTKLWDAIKAGE
jgi:hypothetical protein